MGEAPTAAAGALSALLLTFAAFLFTALLLLLLVVAIRCANRIGGPPASYKQKEIKFLAKIPLPKLQLAKDA